MKEKQNQSQHNRHTVTVLWHKAMGKKRQKKPQHNNLNQELKIKSESSMNISLK